MIPGKGVLSRDNVRISHIRRKWSQMGKERLFLAKKRASVVSHKQVLADFAERGKPPLERTAVPPAGAFNRHKICSINVKVKRLSEMGLQ